MANYINNLGQIRVGVRGWVAQETTSNVTDVDATSFITAASITDTTQISALNTLVNDLKTYGLWTKMKALYPFVGGSAASHKFNLKDPRDLNVAFRLTFNGGGTHNATGYQPNGTNGSANTFLSPSANQSLTSAHFSLYSRTSDKSLSIYGSHGIYNSSSNCSYMIIRRNFDNYVGGAMWSESNGGGAAIIASTPDGRGLYMISRTSNNSLNFYKNGTSIISNTLTQSSTLPTNSYWLGGNNGTAYGDYDNKELAFASLGDGLTDTESSNFYISVQKFQTTLGRHVGTPYVSDPDAITFLMAAGITDGTQAASINTLVIRMKADGVWTKMKAIYPFVGGSATSHKFNLKDPRDLDAAFRLVFNGGWVHSSTGALPNATTGYANTFFNPFNNLSIDNTHMSYYSRTNSSRDSYDMGVTITNTNPLRSLHTCLKWGTDVKTYWSMGFQNLTSLSSEVDLFLPSSAVNFLFNKTSSTSTSLFVNNTKYTASVTNRGLPNGNFYLGARNLNGIADLFADRQSAFVSIGDGLTDTEASTFYNAVQAYQTTLGRQVNVPLVSDTDAQSFLNAANITSFQQASAVNKLVVDLKAAGVWSKMKAIYPFVGGSATSHKFNLKDPRDLDAAYRLVFYGGMTHTNLGMVSNYTTSYASTNLTPSTTLSSFYSQHVSVYSQTSTATPANNINSIGEWQDGTRAMIMKVRNLSNVFSWEVGNSGVSVTNNDGRGFYLASTIANNSIKLYKDNTNVATNTSTFSGSLPSQVQPIGKNENKTFSFATIGDGLTDTDATSLYTAVQTYQTALGRSVNTPIYNNGLVLNLDAGNANSYPGTGTTWFDLSSGNNGTLTNGPTYDTTNGGSIVFDGVNDYVVTNDTSFRFGNKFTMNLWFYWDGLNKTNNSLLSKRMGSAGNYNQYAMGISNGDTQYGGTGKVLFFYARVDGSTGGNDPFDVSITYTLPTAGFYNACIVMDTNSQKLYVNGILVGSNSKNLSGKTYNIAGRELILGAARGENATDVIAYASTKIHRFSVYSYSLTETEVISNFNSTRGRFGL